MKIVVKAAVFLPALLLTCQFAAAQKVTSRVINFTKLAAYEAAHPELLRRCATCPRKEADAKEGTNEAWEGINNPNMPLPKDANVKTQVAVISEKGTGINPGAAILPDIPSRTPAQDWLGHVDPGNTIPPDSHGAVGLNHVITATNDFIRIHNKAGGAQVSQVTISGFTGVPNTCDPYMIFDPTAQRWIFSAIGCANVGNFMILMTSNTADPTGTWRTITWVPAGVTMLLDHPYVGFDNNMIVLSGRRFEGPNLNSLVFGGSSLFLINKAAMYAGTAITFGTNAQQIDRNAADGDAPLPVTVYDMPFSSIGNPAPGTFYILQAWNSTSIRLTTVTGNIPSATWNTGAAVFPTSTLAAWNNGNIGNRAEQTVETRLLAVNDARISCGVMMNGRIWAAHHVTLPATGTPDRVAVQWWQLDGTPGASLGNVLQNGRIGGTTARTFKWFPSIAVNNNDDVLIGYTASSNTTRVGAAYVTRQANTPINTTDDEFIYHAGENRYWKDLGSGRARWGDYSHSSLDPVDGSLWTIQEYASLGSGSIPPDNNSRYGVWWAQVAASACISNITITGAYNRPFTQSGSWIVSSGQTTVSATSSVKLDANPGSGFVELKPAAATDFFQAAPTAASGVFVAQALDGCGAQVPTRITGNPLEKNGSDANSGPEINSSKLEVLPNPAKGVFVVSAGFDLTNAKIQLMSLNGAMQQISIQDMGVRQRRIICRSLSPGFYLIKVIKNGKTAVEKIEIQ
jgi:hypothetical protein